MKALRRTLCKATIFTFVLALLSYTNLSIIPDSMVNAMTMASTSDQVSNYNAITYCTITSEKQGVIAGSTTDSSKPGQIKLLDFNHESERMLDPETNELGDISRPKLFTIVKEIDKASVKLLKAFISKEKLSSVTLNTYKTYLSGPNAGTDYISYTVKLKGVTISSRRTFKNSGLYKTYSEELILSYDFKDESFIKSDTGTTPLSSAVCQLTLANQSDSISTKLLTNNIGYFEVESFDNIFAQIGTSKEYVHSFTILKGFDKSSPIIKEAYENGRLLTDVTFKIIKPSNTGELQIVYTIKLKNAIITSRKLLMENPDDHVNIRNYEELTLTYDTIQESDTVINTIPQI